MSTTILFNIRGGSLESLRGYLTQFNEVTIMVIHPNQEMFVGAFHNKLRVGNFN